MTQALKSCEHCPDSWSCFVKPFGHTPEKSCIAFNVCNMSDQGLCRFAQVARGPFRTGLVARYTLGVHRVQMYDTRIFDTCDCDPAKVESLLENKTIAMFLTDSSAHMYEHTSVIVSGTTAITENAIYFAYLELEGKYVYAP